MNCLIAGVIAGELVDEYKASDKPNEADQCEWQSWLYYRHSHYPYWISDLRQETPLEPIFWGVLPSKEEWLKIEPAQFDELLNVQHKGTGHWMLIDASITIKDPSLSGEINIKTALVNKNKSQALMRALHVVANPYNYGLPYEDDEREEIDTEDFKLHGLLLNWSDESSFDDNDPLQRQLGHRVVRPGGILTQYFQLEPDQLYLRHFSKNSNEGLITSMEIWSDNPKQERIYSMYSEGKRFWIKFDALCEFLESIQCSLIVKARIRRKEERRDERYSEPFDPGKVRVYLIHSNGTIESVDGCHSIRKEN